VYLLLSQYISAAMLQRRLSANLFRLYTETVSADFSSKEKSADFLKLFREFPSLPILSAKPLLFPIDSAVVFNK
jgi:hypothetical protein